MVRAQPFSGLDSENPCNHLLDFEEMCSCLSISGMTQENLKWTLCNTPGVCLASLHQT
jgi:hypothetical protein